MQIGQRIFDGHATDGVDGVKHSGLLNEEQRALAGVGEAGADADALVFLADPDQPRAGHFLQRGEQARRRGDVGHRDDELDTAVFKLFDDARAGKI